MSENNINDELDPELGALPEDEGTRITQVSGMYKDYFLDYASYVILERAVPALNDGLKPVQRRLLHAMKEMDDGRYHKVANIIGQTMRFHPHGDASIGDALVQMGQKELLIDTQGNWGNILTGDGAAAPRYIEARLTKFALHVAYSPKVTEWQLSYDGRANEPLHLPMKFPMLLAMGVEGIAVGLSTKILPHNFNELVDASIKVLQEKSFKLVPDFPTGGIADFSNYNDGLRGSRVRVRARISQLDKNTLVITEIPFSTTTQTLIDSVLKANDKGKIKIKKIEDNTAENVEILVHLPPGISPDKTIDALYAFTSCEVSIAPLSCSIHEDTPLFLGVRDILKRSTEATKGILKAELEIKLSELQEQWHFASLERIFIEHKIYRDIEEAETWEQVIEFIHKGLQPHIGHLMREITEEDIVRLTEIRIKRISKFDSDKANDKILELEGKIEAVKYDLDHLVDFAINYFKDLKERFGKGRERKTEMAAFDSVEAAKVVIQNQKLYVNREEGFVGYGMKRDEYVCDCSDIDDVIVIRRDGKYSVSKVKDKAFFGKDIIHVSVWKKGDERTVYNTIYTDGASKVSFVKRFAVTSITRDREYDITQGTKGSDVIYFTANPNGEAEVVTVLLRQLAKLKKLKFDLDFAQIAVKGRSSKGNITTKFPIKRVELKERGESTLEARKVWFDPTVQRLNADERGELLGSFRGEDRLLIGLKNGTLKVVVPELTLHFDPEMIFLKKLEERPITAVYFDGEKDRYFVKRFDWEGGDKEENIITAHPKSELVFLSNDTYPRIELDFRKVKGKERENEEVDLAEFIAVKGIKAKGNQLTTETLNKVIALESLPEPELEELDDDDIDHDGDDQGAGNEGSETSQPTSESAERTTPAPSESRGKSSYDADGMAPQITLDF
ncbi:MAG: hypothetical protein RL754_783 [Bacteroidota bacterium]|jgi:topoisomerase-4 subunit A